jgi:hypothetical protein
MMIDSRMTLIQAAEARILEALDELQPMFGDGCKLTFVMRHETKAERWLVVSRDSDLREVASTVLKAAVPTPDTQVEP